jgi:hypothetical protein
VGGEGWGVKMQKKGSRQKQKKGRKPGERRIQNPIRRSGFGPSMWDFMRDSLPKSAKIGVFIQNLQTQK